MTALSMPTRTVPSCPPSIGTPTSMMSLEAPVPGPWNWISRPWWGASPGTTFLSTRPAGPSRERIGGGTCESGGVLTRSVVLSLIVPSPSGPIEAGTPARPSRRRDLRLERGRPVGHRYPALVLHAREVHAVQPLVSLATEAQ